MRKFPLLFSRWIPMGLAFLLTGIIKAQSLTTAAIVIANVSCHGGDNGVTNSISTGGTTPYTYLWSPGGQTNQIAGGLVAATYTVRVTDHVGNSATSTATVNQPTAPLSITAWAKYPSVCPLSSDSLFSSGSGGSAPYSYTWQGPIADISCPSCQNTSVYPDGGVYVITAVNDAAGCTATSSVAITVYPVPLVSITGPLSPVSYTSDTLTAISPGASSYLWSNSATTSTIIVSPAGTTTYSVKTTNSFGCYDTNHYTVSANTGNGNSSGTAIPVSPSTNVGTTSYSSLDSVVWFSFVAADSNNQIIAYSNWLSEPVPHVHRLTLYNNSMQTIMDENMPDIVGANQIRLDISHLTIGNTYYVRAARCPAHANMPGCNPSASGECNPSMRWDFQMCFRTVPVFVPNDSGNEAPSVTQLYYESRGQIADLNDIPRFDIKAYTNNTKPAIFCTDSAISFVYQHVDTMQRVDMVLTGSSVQPSEPVFKMQEDSNAGYLNYFLGYVPNGVPEIEGYSRLVYKNEYPNVDMQVYSNNDGTKFYFVCNPGSGGGAGGNPANIELQFNGANSVSVTGGGGLNVNTKFGTLSFAPGYAYTDSAGIIKPKSWQPYFVTVNSNTVKFNTGSYNTSEPLIIRIDRGHKTVGSYPSIDNLDWSTYFGGADEQDLFNDVCSDAAGNVYATGATQSSFYPVTAGVVQYSLVSDLDATIAKFKNNTDSDALAWATYYGGNNETVAYGIALDASSNIYITGYTGALPLASNPSSPNNYVQSSLVSNYNNVGYNAFITMLTNDGQHTRWATYYGGGGREQGKHIVIDKNANVYVVGGGVDSLTNSYFPIHKSSHAGAYIDSIYGTGFILEFNASNPSAGITREWATRIGDNGHAYNLLPNAYLYGCTVDAHNNFYVTGYASGNGYTSPATLTFPYTVGGRDAVVTKFNANNNVDWSSYYGGDEDDDGRAIMVDASGNVYITGQSQSDSSFGIGIQTKKLGSGFFQRSNPYFGDGYIAEFDSVGSLKWGTYFGGSNSLAGQAITMDSYGNLYVTGWDDASDMPLPTNPAGVYNQTSGVPGWFFYNGFIAAFSSPTTNPDYVWGTYFGEDLATGMCITKSNGHNWLYIVGNLGNGFTPLVFPKGSWQEDTFYLNASATEATSFISQFDIDPILGPAGIPVIDNWAGNMQVYPNPTTQNATLQISLLESEDVQVSVMDLLGETIFTATYKGEHGIFQQEIPLSSLPAAAYIIKAQTKDNVYYNKILKLQ